MEKYVCVHGHFYQPPRENPWLEEIEVQDSAYPYHDWNAKISEECYGPNGTARMLDSDGKISRITNNYSKISFNLGPTILQWMQKRAPEKYAKILEADRISSQELEGHGAAIAQVYNHMIMPLSNSRDKKTQIIWGKRDFEFRFGRAPEGMWLAETAVDNETLDLLAANGILYTILAPRQAHLVREIGASEWNDVSDGRVDPKRPYKASLPSGADITLFFYDGPVSQAIAFEQLLESGERFADRLMEAFSDDQDEPQLVHIATDGESYGHHHRHGEMALAYALDHIESSTPAKITNYGYYLSKYPPTYEAQIYENSSWSCVHGIERWRSDCGCNSGGHGDWNQSWREPLRNALDWLRDAVADEFEQVAGSLVKDPWAARDGYVDIILDRSPAQIAKYIETYADRELTRDEEIKLLKLMEMQRHCMLMYTSCGWFFDELSGMETVQVIVYAGRVIQLAQDLFHNDYETEFLNLLEHAKSNIPDHQNGRVIYNKWVKPNVLDLTRVGAHYAVNSLFEEYTGTTAIDVYSANQEDFQLLKAGRVKLVTGQATIESGITHESEQLSFGALHLGDHTINCGIGPHMDEETYQEYVVKLHESFKAADFPEIIRSLDDYFGSSAYSLTSLFEDEKRKVMQIVLAPAMEQTEALTGQLYEMHAPLFLFMRNANLRIPEPLAMSAEFVLNTRLQRAFQQSFLDPLVIEPLLEEMSFAGVKIDETTIEYSVRMNLEEKARRLLENPEHLELMEEILAILTLIEKLPFEVNTWKLQNMAWELSQSVYQEAIKKHNIDNERAGRWLDTFRTLANKLWLEVPE